MKRLCVKELVCCLCIVGYFVGFCEAWAGNTVTTTHSWSWNERYCCKRFWGICVRHCHRTRTNYYRVTQCAPGWKHNADQNCIIPICLPSCANGGHCRDPNDCWCPTWSQGPGCRQLTCSYRRPCFPGDCQEDESCRCEPGFSFTSYSDGCIKFNSEDLKPAITMSTVSFGNIRRFDGKTLFMFIMDGTNKTDTDILWRVIMYVLYTDGDAYALYIRVKGSNQKDFNNLWFELESLFIQPDQMPQRPLYVHDSGLGIVSSHIEANVSKVPKNGGPIRDEGSFKSYPCGFTKDSPKSGVAVCNIHDEQFVTSIEHGDWLNVRFYTESGGFQKLLNTDANQIYSTKYYRGYEESEQVEFRFDFLAPKHCSQNGSFAPCPPGNHSLKVDNEFTKDPIRVTWLGWTDDLSGLDEYDVEVFKLGPSPSLIDALIELTPLDPVYSVKVPHSNISHPMYTPTQPGMYSVLITAHDKANNSRIARRLVLYDNKSMLEVSNSSSAKLYISSASPETNYRWQSIPQGGKLFFKASCIVDWKKVTSYAARPVVQNIKSLPVANFPTDGNVTFVVNWTDHFVNRIHTDEKLLDRVADYPIQFEEIEDENILFSKKFVETSLDDHEGNRTVDKIPNFNGVVKFELDTADQNIAAPDLDFQTIELAQTVTFYRNMTAGDGVRVTVRATDAMGHVTTDTTTVRVDSTLPRISNKDDPNHRLQLNIANGTYNFTSRVFFSARDDESGVFRLGFKIILHLGHKDMEVESSTNATTGKPSDFDCITVDGVCYLSSQKIDIDNCLFMVNKDDLDTANATLVITAYNQAMMQANTTFEVTRISELKGLEKYSGPTNFRIEQATINGFRVAWDLPEQSSCYGLADVVIFLYKLDAGGQNEVKTYYATGSTTFIDILGLNAVTNYNLTFGIKSSIGPAQDIGISLAFKTPAEQEEGTGVGANTVIGVAIGVLGIVAISMVVFVVLVRRGVIHPRERVVSIRRAVTRKYRQTVYGDLGVQNRSGEKGVKYDNRQSELYIYGEMTLEGPQIWEISRNDVVLETLLKTGSFALIYKAQMSSNKTTQTVLAKTLKENYSPQDELLMKAKINFSGTQVGDHQNVLKFIGAVTDNETMGPFIIYEFCENGTLRDYMAARKDDVTMELQENMFRFGLEVARGMAYLVSRKIVHRRLAARNILLTFLNEVKVAGFGPQPSDELDDDADQGKKERIPIKWMAPECMKSTRDATEHSDVWSYAVVLWEIFSLGETPYNNIRSRDLPAKIKKGLRLPKPDSCDDTWYEMMKRCWAYDASKRPTFSDVTAELDNLFVAAPGDDYYYCQR